MGRKKNDASKNSILDAAFVLYSTRTYDQVRFEDFENATKLSRGAILYHFKNKELIFKTMCDKFLLEKSSAFLKLEKYEDNTALIDYIKQYIKTLKAYKRKANVLGVKNLNKALINITLQALFYYPDFAEKGLQWQLDQVKQWKKALIRAVSQNEIREDIDLDITSELFEDVYCGLAYSSLPLKDGIDLKKLESDFYFIYDSIKK